MNVTLHCPNPLCRNVLAKGLNVSGKAGEILMEMRCPHCGENVELSLAAVAKIKPKADVRPRELIMKK